jgi:hypothetical protein
MRIGQEPGQPGELTQCALGLAQARGEGRGELDLRWQGMGHERPIAFSRYADHAPCSASIARHSPVTGSR